MDDSSGSPKSSRPGARPSLVERAAEKIAARTRKAEPRDTGSAAQTQPMPDQAAAQPSEVADGEHVAVEAPGVSLEEAVRIGVMEGAPKRAGGTGMPPAPGQSKSRLVKIDTARLAANHILTPQTKRNRTVEEFRLIKRMVLNRRWDDSERPGNTIVVTSALPSEGKTTTAINLAMSIAAEEDLRVLLVDADFIKSDALRQLGVTASKGLVDVLQNPSMDISDVMLRTNIEKLSLVPSGQLHERCTELLASARMDEIITELANRYQDRILIFDSPPLLATTESVVLASHMGQIVFVVQAGRTKRESVVSALEMLGEGPQLGLVLNRTTARFGNSEFGSYYGYGYGYGYGQEHEAERQAAP